MKCCKTCGEEKALGAFSKGRASCKPCRSAAEAARYRVDLDASRAANRERRAKDPEAMRAKDRRQWEERKNQRNNQRQQQRATDLEAARARGKAYRDANRERAMELQRESYWRNRDRLLTEQRGRRAADPDKYRALAKASRDRHRARINARQREYYRANPERWEVLRAKRNARKAGVEHKPYTRTEIFERDEGRCRGCGKDLENKPHGFQIDHIVPISLGGPDIPANVQLMCPKCNRAKWANLEGQIHLAV